MFWAHEKWIKFSKKSTFLFMSKENIIRRAAVYLITHKRFDQFIIFLIALNSILLGIRNYEDVDNLTEMNKFIEKSD